MASGTNTVGSVKYDASIDLAQLKKSLTEADKLVQKSYDNQSKAAKKAAKTTSNSSQSSSNGSTAYDAQTRVNAIKREAQETAKTLSTYTPQIQKQFLTVERANNQVTSATVRSTAAIQNYGAGSVQATNATNALNVATQNQSQQQSKLTSMLDGSYKSQNSFTSSMANSIVAIGGVVAGLSVLNTTMNTIRNSVKAANEFEASIAGLSRLAERFGYDANDATAAAQSLANDGLITVSTAANGLQKLLTAGVGLPDAIKLMQGYKDQAAFGRASTIDFDTAVGNLSESFYTENSMIGNLSGQTENWNRILDYGASVLGKSVSQLSEKERVQAKLIGQQRLNNLVEGDSAVLAQTNAGRQAQLNQTLKEMRITIGRITNEITSGFIGALGGMDAESQKVAISFGAGATAFVGFLTIVPLAITAFRAIRSALVSIGVASAFASGGITAILGGIAALGTGLVVSNLIDNLDTTEELSDKFGKNVKAAAGGLGESAKNASKTADQLSKINDQMQEARDNFRYSLAQLVAEKNENIATLTKTLTEEERAYKDAYAERLTSFDKTQNEELLTHEQKTRALQNQIDFLTKYNTAANKKQLSELQFALAQEDAEYQRSTQLRQGEFDAQTQSAKDEYEARRAENQKKLDEELTLLQNHRQDVLGIQNVMLLDEIDSLKKQRDEQLKSLQKQKQDVISSAQQASQGAIDAYDSLRPDANKTGENLGNAIGNGMKDALKKAIVDTGKGIANFLGSATTFLVKGFDPRKSSEGLSKIWQEAQNDPAFGFRASGGPVTAGNPYFVGDNPNGSINRTTELFVPKTNGTIIPANEVQKALGNSGGGQAINVTVNIPNGVFVANKSDKRQFANEIGKLINETVKSKTGSVAIAGI